VTAIEQLGDYVVGSSSPLSAGARELVELHVIDAVGAWIAGTQTPEGTLLQNFRAAMQADGRAAGALALDLATRCALARLSEIDDIHLASMTTPGAIVVPAALTLAAAKPATSADDAIGAIVSGYEAMTRLGRAIDGPAALYRGIWPTYFAAPFAVAGVAARLLKLDTSAATNALALALTLAAPGVGHHNERTGARWFAIGRAARTGLAAALAAQHGFTADVGLVEGRLLPDVYGIAPDVAALTDGLVERRALTEVSFKPWCAARQTMAATQALKEIIEGGVSAEAIDAITVAVPPPQRKMIDHGVIAGNRASHLTSVQYALAVAALAPERAFALSPPDVSPAVAGFMRKIEVRPDETLLADYPRRWPARLTVTAGAARHARLVTDVPGDPARPFDRARVREKFLRFAGPVVGRDQAEQILAQCGEALASGQFASLVYAIEQATGQLDRAPQ
jgi:2-methylcitrate dehydratase PrpD